jgi:LmbE family N-acetylglucosaminyl deacetylase
MPTLENRRTIVRLIREWKADLVITHRTNDYHPDHRYTGVLVQDAAFMVTVPSFCPGTPHLAKNPVFMYSSDRFQKPAPFEADIAVSSDDVFDQKVEALWQLESQVESLWALRSFEGVVPVPASGPERAARRQLVKDGYAKRFGEVADNARAKLIELYGKERGEKVLYAESFGLSEYGYQPNPEELKKLFPFFGE